MALVPVEGGLVVNPASVVSLTVGVCGPDAVVSLQLVAGRAHRWRYVMDPANHRRYIERAEEQRAIVHVLLAEQGVPLVQVGARLFIHPAHVHALHVAGSQVKVVYGPEADVEWVHCASAAEAAAKAADLTATVNTLT